MRIHINNHDKPIISIEYTTLKTKWKKKISNQSHSCKCIAGAFYYVSRPQSIVMSSSLYLFVVENNNRMLQVDSKMRLWNIWLLQTRIVSTCLFLQHFHYYLQNG
jgi:hypothetical protein